MSGTIKRTARHLAGLFLPRPMAVPVDMSGRNVIVTGASPGSLGYETARILACWGARVVATCRRNVPRMEAALKDELRRRGADGNNLEAFRLDLCDPDSVTGFAAWYRDRYRGRLHVLINNAGIYLKTLAPRREAPLSGDGVELHWRTNYLGAFHLTRTLLPLLQRTGTECGDARVVNVSSGLHVRAGNRDLFDDAPHRDRSRYHSRDAYARSKLAMIHMAFELDRRFAESHNLLAVAVHPGAVLTNLTLPGGLRGPLGRMAYRIGFSLASLVLPSPNTGAQTIVMCASHRPLEGGKYYERCAVAGSSADSRDGHAAKRLWDQTEQWVGTLTKPARHAR